MNIEVETKAITTEEQLLQHQCQATEKKRRKAPIGKTTAPQMTPAQMMDYWEKEGILGPWGGDQDSVELARELRKKAETRDHSK